MGGPEAVRDVVTAFVDEVTDALAAATAGVPGTDRAGLRHDVVLEAFNLTAAFVDVDDRHTDNELRALVATFGPLLPDAGLARATPADLRAAGVVAGKAAWLGGPSTMFEILADRPPPTEGAWTYYRRALDVAHTVASLDDVATETELRAIGRFRTLLLGRLAERDATPTPAEAAARAEEDTAAAPAPPLRPLEEVMAELEALVGLEEVKAEVRLLTDFLRVQQLRARRDLPTIDVGRHLVFVGNPGTGKTTVARLLAAIYHSLGVLDRGQLVETDRTGVVAGFVGQTAPLVARRFDEADGGMLFIDEAYTLARGGPNDFGREAIDAVVKLMEDRRERVALVVAGYPDEMRSFLDANPGLRSRFPRTITFPDYSTAELVAIFTSIGDRHHYRLDESGRAALVRVLDAAPRGKGFGNGRLARNLFEAAIGHQASRLLREERTGDDDLVTLTAADVTGAADAVAEAGSP